MRLKCLVILCVHRMKFLIFLGYEINTCKFEVSCKIFLGMLHSCLFLSREKKEIKRVWRDSLDWVNLKIVAKGFEHVWRKFLRESMFSEEGQVLKWTEHEEPSAADLPWLHPQGVRENSLLDLLQAEQHCELLFFDFSTNTYKFTISQALNSGRDERRSLSAVFCCNPDNAETKLLRYSIAMCHLPFQRVHGKDSQC